MSQTLAVAARELRERWLLLPGGLVLGFLPLILPAFGLPAEAPPTVGLLVAVLLGTISAVVIGSSMLARDASDGRLGFLFSRPIPWGAIWGGKWLAAIVLATGSGALAALPSMVASLPHPDSQAVSWGTALLDPQGATFFVLLLLLGVGLANFGATAFRSRSAWLALDLGLLLVAAYFAWRWVAPLYSLGLFHYSPMAGWVLLLPLVWVAGALVVASAAQTASGRTDIRRAHRAMSLVFWAAIFVSLGAAGLRLAWARAATPADLERYVSGSYDPSGRWLYAAGLSRRGGEAAFLVDTEQGRYVPLGFGGPWGWSLRSITFAPDGRSAVLLESASERGEIVSVELGDAGPRFTTLELENAPSLDFGARLALSPSGAYILFAHEHGASLFENPSGRRVATATIPPGWRPAAARFVEEAVGRVWVVASTDAPPRAEMRLLEIALDREPRTASFPLGAMVDRARPWSVRVQADASGRRFLTRDGALRLRDGEAGALLATLVEGLAPGSLADLRTLGGVFLADGRIVVGQAVGARTILHVFDPDGSPLDDVALDRVPVGLAVGPEVSPGRVAVRLGLAFENTETLVVDVTQKRVIDAFSGRPLFLGYSIFRDSMRAATTIHFLMENGAIVRRDFATGEERVVAGAGAPVGERLMLP